jgi:DNA-binding transcriptional ArsR family regulator
MDRIAAALGDGARWRIVELLAERPRSVGELAALTGLRQPQTTKHLQTLARAGLVTVFPLGQRRVYAVENGPLKSLGSRLTELVEATEAHAGERDVIARYRAAIDAESAIADRTRWADGRTFTFERVLAAPPDVVWRHWVDPDLLRSWWAPPSMTIADCRIEPKPESERLEFELSMLDTPGSFTGHYDLGLTATPGGTRLRLELRITETTVEAVPYIAGIESGWGEVLDNLTARLTTNAKDPQS